MNKQQLIKLLSLLMLLSVSSTLITSVQAVNATTSMVVSDQGNDPAIANGPEIRGFGMLRDGLFAQLLRLLVVRERLLPRQPVAERNLNKAVLNRAERHCRYGIGRRILP